MAKSVCRFKLGFLHWGCTLVLHWGYSLVLRFWTCKKTKAQKELPEGASMRSQSESSAGGSELAVGGTPCKDQELTVDQDYNSCNPFKLKFILSACKNFRFSQSDGAIFLACMAKCIISIISIIALIILVARPSPSSPSLRPPSSSRSPSSHGGWWPRRKDIGLRTVYSIQYTATTCASTKHNGPPHHTLTTIHLSKPRPPRTVVPRGFFGVPAIGMKNSDICFCKTKLRNTETCRCHCTMPPPLLVDGRWTWSLAAHRCSSWSRLLHKSDDMNKHIHARYTGSAQPCLVGRRRCCGTTKNSFLCGAKPHWARPKENRENEKMKKWEKRSIKHAHHAPWPPAIPNGREGPSNGHCTRSRPGITD